MGRLIGLLILTALACNAPIGGEGTTSPPPPSTSAVVTPQLLETPTASPTAATDPGLEPSPTGGPLPTFTPIQVTPPPGATIIQTPVSTVTVISTSAATATAEGEPGPLTFAYAIVWEVAANNPGIAIATVTIQAAGGGGGYQYFRDDLPVSGPVFQYQWATCRANPGSLRVDSADGQTARVNYFETPPCPQPQ
jgi:hypothetical protein